MTSRVTIPFEKYRLDNGLTVILHEDRRLPIAAVNLWYHVGAKDEPRGRSGFAHLFEHLMFMGTHRAPHGQFDQIMEKGGGSNNATTSADRTNYYSTGPASLLPTLLWLEADRLEHLGHAMTQQKLDLQRAVVRNERRQSYENEPYGMAELAVDGLMYPAGHPYHIPVIGTHEDLVAATVQDVKDFFATWYCPNNCALVVAGDFDRDATKQLVDSLFGTLPRRSDPEHRTAAPVRLDGPRFHQTTDPHVEFSRATFVWHSPAGFEPGDSECDLLSKILTDGLSSRLHKRLIYDEPLAHSVTSYQQSQRLGSMFRVDVIAQEGIPLERIEAAVDAELDRIRRDGPTDEELTRVKNQMETEAVLALQRVLERADRLNYYDAQFGDPDGFERDFQRYRDATREGIRDWARRVLDPAERLRMHVHPAEVKAGEAGPPAAAADAPAQAAPVAAAPWRPIVPTPRDTRPGDLAERPFEPEPSVGFRIAPDVWCLLHERHDLPLVRILFRFDGGSLLDPAEKAGLADLAAQLLKEGAKDRGALEFSMAIDRLGAAFDSGADHDSVLAQLVVLKANLRPALELALDALENPRFDEDAFRRIKTQALGALKQRAEQPGLVARVVSNAEVCGPGHPIGRPTDGFVDTMSAVSLDDVRAFWARQVRQRMQVLVAGDLTRGEVLDLLRPRLAELPSIEDDETAVVAGSTPIERGTGLRVLLVDRPGAPQTVIRFVWPGIHHGDPERIPLSLATTILGGSFTSRLNHNLREVHGFTYGARAGIEYHPGLEAARVGPSLVSSSSSVHTDVTGESVGEFLREFARMRQGDITDDEVRKARSTLRNNRIQAGETLDGLLAEMDALVTFDLPLNQPVADLRSLELVTAEHVNGAARRVLHPDGGVLILVGDRAAILPQLAGLELPAPRIVLAP